MSKTTGAWFERNRDRDRAHCTLNPRNCKRLEDYDWTFSADISRFLLSCTRTRIVLDCELLCDFKTRGLLAHFILASSYLALARSIFRAGCFCFFAVYLLSKHICSRGATVYLLSADEFVFATMYLYCWTCVCVYSFYDVRSNKLSREHSDVYSRAARSAKMLLLFQKFTWIFNQPSLWLIIQSALDQFTPGLTVFLTFSSELLQSQSLYSSRGLWLVLLFFSFLGRTCGRSSFQTR